MKDYEEIVRPGLARAMKWTDIAPAENTLRRLYLPDPWHSDFDAMDLEEWLVSEKGCAVVIAQSPRGTQATVYKFGEWSVEASVEEDKEPNLRPRRRLALVKAAWMAVQRMKLHV